MGVETLTHGFGVQVGGAGAGAHDSDHQPQLLHLLGRQEGQDTEVCTVQYSTVQYSIRTLDPPTCHHLILVTSRADNEPSRSFTVPGEPVSSALIKMLLPVRGRAGCGVEADCS